MINYLDTYLLPLMAVVGLAGNMVSFVVFVATYMRRLSSSVYLAALSMVDMVFLLCVLFSWGVNIGVDLYQQDGWCQTFIYLTYVSSFLSVWYVVSFTVERYIAVHYPLRRYDFCTTGRAKMVVVGLALFAALLYSFGTWTSGVTVYLGMPVCGPLPKYGSAVSIINNIDTIITLILPFLAILIMNVKIAYKVIQFYRARRTVTEHRCALSRDSERASDSFGRLRITVSNVGRSGYLRNQVRVTKMLLTVSSIFLLLNLPRHSVRVYSFIRNLSEPTYIPQHQLIVWQRVFHFLYYLHFCINVFLYSALGTNFRKAFFWLLRRIKHNIVDQVHAAMDYACCQRLSSSTSSLQTTSSIPISGGSGRPGGGTAQRPLLCVRDFRYNKCTTRNNDYV